MPPFADAPQTKLGISPDARKKLPTELEGDEQSGTVEIPVLQGNVALSRGDQFLGTDKLTFDSEKETYVAEGKVRFRDSGMRIVAERATGSQAEDTHRIEDLKYQLTDRRGNGGAAPANGDGRPREVSSDGVLHNMGPRARMLRAHAPDGGSRPPVRHARRCPGQATGSRLLQRSARATGLLARGAARLRCDAGPGRAACHDG